MNTLRSLTHKLIGTRNHLFIQMFFYLHIETKSNLCHQYMEGGIKDSGLFTKESFGAGSSMSTQTWIIVIAVAAMLFYCCKNKK